MLVRIGFALASAATLSGCVAALAAPSLLVGGGSYLGVKSYSKHGLSQVDRQTASAQAIGGDLNINAIKVSKVEKDSSTVSWFAALPDGRNYMCRQEIGHTTATCTKAK